MLDRFEMTRRDMLKLSAAGVVGGSVSGWFGTLATRAAETAKTGMKHKSCILLFMNGGPAQSHTFDLKDNSEYKKIATSVSGIEISEHLPKVAEQMKHLAILRSMSTGDGNHPTARYLMHTGYRAGAGGTTYPSIGSIVSAELGKPDAELPNFVSVAGNGLSPGYLGPKHAALNVIDPSRGVENLAPTTALSELDARASLIDELDKNFLNEYGATAIEAHQKGYQKALQLMHSPKAKAFDLSQEPSSVRDAYGRGSFGQGCLLARRLIESGVSFVEVSLGGWDTHQGAAQPVQRLSQQLDPGFGTLVKELAERGLLETTLVIWMGEFGRSPGRGQNHYARAWSTVMGGAGLKVGQVVGKTDRSGGTVDGTPIRVVDFMATICKALGIDHNKQLVSKSARPFRIVDKGAKTVDQLFG